jgi:nicotinamide phosphoribosyltransferase
MSHNGLTTDQAKAVWGPGEPSFERHSERFEQVKAERNDDTTIALACEKQRLKFQQDSIRPSHGLDTYVAAKHAPVALLRHTLGFNNPLLDVDSYKVSHSYQYPPGTEQVYSYIESRGGEFDSTLFFGLQVYLKRWLAKPINHAQIQEASDFYEAHGEPFDRTMWDHILEAHDGFLPIEIRALPEGIVVPVGTVLVTVTNTDSKCAALVSFLETALLRAVWYPTTIATLSRECKVLLKRAFDRTSDDPAGLAFKLHDFGARGVSSQESAALGGMAHLINFMGSDTVSGILAANEYYGEAMAGFSIPASEHSTITSWGRDHEVDAYRNMLQMFGGGQLVANVSDSYDIDYAVSEIFGKELRQEILDMEATLVVRPDSGDPVTTPIRVVKMLDHAFGHTVNSKGYKVLNPKVRVLQGDGITLSTIGRIIYSLTELEGYSIDNLSFGMGGGLLQQVNRDTQKFAMKCSAVKVDGVWRDVYKAPAGQPDKRSKRGRFQVVSNGARGWDVVAADDTTINKGMLQPVWCDGKLKADVTFKFVRAMAASSFNG